MTQWTCPGCGEKVDGSFAICWQCGTTPEGVEDPDFVHADAAGAIVDPPGDLDATPADEILDEFGTPLPELVACYQAMDVMEAKFLADQLMQQGIPAVADIVDPSAHGQLGVFWGGGPRIRVRAEDEARARAWLDAHEQRRKARRDRGT
jgi:Putative prokaryotic signal transducing protein